MGALDWTTEEGLAAIREYLAGKIAGWRMPVTYAVGLSPATSSPEWDFGYVNLPGGRHGLPAVVLATILGHDGSTKTIEVSKSDLREAITSLAPARACTSLPHPNLAAWEAALAEVSSNPMRTMCAVFVADLGDPVSSEADGSLRTLIDGYQP